MSRQWRCLPRWLARWKHFMSSILSSSGAGGQAGAETFELVPLERSGSSWPTPPRRGRRHRLSVPKIREVLHQKRKAREDRARRRGQNRALQPLGFELLLGQEPGSVRAGEQSRDDQRDPGGVASTRGPQSVPNGCDGEDHERRRARQKTARSPVHGGDSALRNKRKAGVSGARCLNMFRSVIEQT